VRGRGRCAEGMDTANVTPGDCMAGPGRLGRWRRSRPRLTAGAPLVCHSVMRWRVP
jgi:hypothetical protein